MGSSPKFVYCLNIPCGPYRIYPDKDEAIMALLSCGDRFCHCIDTYDLDKRQYVRGEWLLDVVDEAYLDRLLIRHHHLTDAVAEVKQHWAESAEYDRIEAGR